MTDKQAQREKFEAWAEEAGALPWGHIKKQRTASGNYSVQIYTYMWQAWNACHEALLDELDAKDNRINRLEAIVAVAEQRNALMREWKRALKVPCDLVDDQVPVVIHGMVVRLERLKETEAKLEAAESRIAELEAREVKLTDINCFLADVDETTLANALRLLAEGVRAADISAIRRAGISVTAAGKGEAS